MPMMMMNHDTKLRPKKARSVNRPGGGNGSTLNAGRFCRNGCLAASLVRTKALLMTRVLRCC